ncbi:MAG: RidA family protein [Prolixibacteraceae bacterium]|nr:RidA family protein [Prolixibacteraceae bacterium]MBN2774743.1 RidA family protein [Prolixibacteraceae bacterium]
MADRQNFSSGAKWEDAVGYSRVVRVGQIIEVSGTVAVDEAGNLIGPDNPYEQTRFILNKIIRYVEKAGGKKEDITRTRIFLTDMFNWEEVGKAHSEVFKDIKPVTSFLEVKSLVGLEYLVEIEATAIVH